METARRHERLTVLPLTPLPQCVPSRVCVSCDVCCRFPEPDSFLRPYFTADEIREAVAHGVDRGRFPDPAGSQVDLVPNPSGEGYLCPAFDPATSHCRIYANRPLDCQIYPLALMWSREAGGEELGERGEGMEVVLGWDTKCPFLREGEGRGAGDEVGESDRLPLAHSLLPTLSSFADRIAALLERETMLETLVRNPRLIGRFQDDVVVLRSLPVLTERLLASVPPLTPHSSLLTLRPLILDDRPRFDAALASIDTQLAHYAFAPHFIWRGLLDYGWTEIAGHLCLFAASSDGLFMPLPPLGPLERFAEAVNQAFSFMRERNRGSAVTRIDNVPEALRVPLGAMGYVLKSKDPDYLYRTEELAELAGDRYKSQRAACNRFVRTQTFRYEPYRDDDREECLTLYRRWAAQQEARSRDTLDETGRWMLRDAASAHAEALAHYQALGLTGRVVRVQGAIRAYTFGYARTVACFCVLLEVADRSIPGLAQFIFRELCREAAAGGYASINTMDDSGLPSLARSKRAYRPIRLIPSYVAVEGQVDNRQE